LLLLQVVQLFQPLTLLLLLLLQLHVVQLFQPPMLLLLLQVAQLLQPLFLLLQVRRRSMNPSAAASAPKAAASIPGLPNASSTSTRRAFCCCWAAREILQHV
jgi:hypothetical protein